MVLKQGERAAIERIVANQAAGPARALQFAATRQRVETANQLALKADVTVTDALDARIDTAETNIISQAAVDVDHEGRIATLQGARAGVAVLDDLTDVNTTGKADGEVLTWVAADSAWKSEPAGAGSAIEVLDEGVSETAALASLDFVGDKITATDDGSGNVTVTVSNKITFLGAKVYLTLDKTTINATGGGYTIVWDSTRYDTNGFFTGGSGTRLTIPAGQGFDYVNVEAHIRITSSTVSTYKMFFILHYNSSDVLQEQWGSEADSGTASLYRNVFALGVAVSDGDYFVCLVIEESDTSVTIASVPHTSMALQVVGTS